MNFLTSTLTGTIVPYALGHSVSYRASAFVTTGGTGGQVVAGNGVLTTPAGAIAVPTGVGSTGTRGQLAVDDNFLYVCIQPNTWRRVGLSTF